jgi:hypothetical protein
MPIRIGPPGRRNTAILSSWSLHDGNAAIG